MSAARSARPPSPSEGVGVGKKSKPKSTKTVRVLIVEDGEVILKKDFTDFPVKFVRSSDTEVQIGNDRKTNKEQGVLTEENGEIYFSDVSPNGYFKVNGQNVKKIKIVDEAEIVFQNRKIFVTVLLTADLERLTQPHIHAPDTHIKSFRGGEHGGLELIYPIRPDPRAPIKRWVLEGYVTWKDQICDWKQYRSGAVVYITPNMRTIRDNSAPLYAPVTEAEIIVAKAQSNSARCYLPPQFNGNLEDINGRVLSTPELHTERVRRDGSTSTLELQKGELFSYQISKDVKVFLRYAPAPPRLTLFHSSEQDLSFQQTVLGSAMIHLAIVVMLIVFAPKMEGPKVEGIPPRLARLLVEPPKLLIPPPEEKKPEPPPPPEPKPKEKPKPIVKKTPPPKPKKVVVNVAKIKKVNKYPMDMPTKEAQVPATFKSSVPVKQEVAVKDMGVLGALGATDLSQKISDKPMALNINPNAGGMSGPSLTGGAIGALKAAGGKLAGGGMPGVRTKGMGFGTGTGFGVQGIKGRGGGGHAIAGLVVGAPRLMKLERSEGLTREQVMAELKKHLGQIQSCYETSLISSPSLAGRVEYEWTIRPNGSVAEVHVKSSEMSGGDQLNACVGKIFKSIKFPVATNGQETVPTIGFPFGKQ